MDTKLYPTQKQESFFNETIAGEDGTILTLKRIEQNSRGFAVNIRGPFKLVEYKFKNGSEKVIDATWAGDPESQSHIHCCWQEVKFARLSAANQHVRDSIGYNYQLAFFADEHKANAAHNNESLFWFYLKDKNHKAFSKISENKTINISEWNDSRPPDPDRP